MEGGREGQREGMERRDGLRARMRLMRAFERGREFVWKGEGVGHMGVTRRYTL